MRNPLPPDRRVAPAVPWQLDSLVPYPIVSSKSELVLASLIGVNFVSLLRDVASGAGRWKLRENHLPLDAVTFQFGIVRDARDATARASEETPVGGPKFKSSRYGMPVGPASPGFELSTSTMTTG